jgi:hypothetical protein
MAWKITTDETFRESLWTIQHDLAMLYANDPEGDETKTTFLAFDKFYELLLLLLDEGQIRLGTWFPVRVGGEPQEGYYLLQIEGNPFQGHFQVKGRPIFAGSAILALRAPANREQLVMIEYRLHENRGYSVSQKPEAGEGEDLL